MMQRRRSEPQGAPEWMVTYADVISLLVTFFILLLTFSTLEEDKFHAAAASIRSALSNSDVARGVLARPLPAREPADPTTGPTHSADLVKALEGLDAHEAVDIVDLNGEVRIRIAGDFLFRHGATELGAAAHAFLVDLVRVLVRLPNRLRVEGHASAALGARATPVSILRAQNVLLELERQGIQGSRLGMAAFGASRPAKGSGVRERARDDRVDILVIEADREVQAR